MERLCGFRSARSTFMEMMELVENIPEYIGKKKNAVGILFDLKSAIDITEP